MTLSLHTPAETEHPFAQSLPGTPCDSFDAWSGHPDLRIADAGAKLRATWCAEAVSHPQLAPLVSFAKRCSRLHWPDGETAGALLYDVARLARYLQSLEARLAAAEGDGK